ncbi:MAG: complex I subunit 1 family protein [Candidatus Methanomethylicaceae archaeon]
MILSILIIIIAFFLGILYSFIIRKISARLQWRIGPLVSVYSDLKPILGTTRIIQPLYDILKLLGKQSIIPNVARKKLFISSPIISLIFTIMAVIFIPFPGIPLFSEFPYSLIIASYLLIGASLFSLLGPIASGSPWAAIGTRRETELFLVSELGFVISIFSIAITKNSLNIWEIANSSMNPLLTLVTGTLMIVAILGKLHIKPFDIPEAETEIVAGPYTEYSGKLLGIYYITRQFMIYCLITLFISLFLPPLMSSIIWLPAYFIASIIIVSLLSIIQVLNPRYRILNALIWYTKVITILSILNVLVIIYVRI